MVYPQIARFPGAVYRYLSGRGGFLYAKIMGMDAMLPYFRVLPFADILFTDFFSGLALLIVNGLTNLAAALLSAKKRVIKVKK